MMTLASLSALLLLVIRVMLPGVLAAALTAPGDVRPDVFSRTGRAIFTGVLLNLLLAIAILTVGRWNRCADWVLWSLLVAECIRRHACRGTLLATLRNGGLPVLLVLAAVLLVFHLPVRSEWRMGGWDPGHYQNNSVRIALDGCLENKASRLYTLLSPEERDLLMTRSYGDSYHAISDNLPVNDDGSLPLYFFHLTSIAGAALYRLGGDAFLDRINGFLAFGLLFPFATFLAALGLRGYRRWLPILFMAVSPVWWYHQNFPTSEMLYLFLLLGGAADWLDSRDARRLPWFAWAACFLLVVNHLNAAVLITGLVALASYLETAGEGNPLPRHDRLVRAGGAIAAVAAGFLWDVFCASITIRKLQAENSRMLFVVLLFAASIATCCVMAALPFPERFRNRATRAARGIGLFAAVLLPFVALTSLSGLAREIYYSLYFWLFIPGQMIWWIMRMSPFFNIPSLVLAGAGFACLALQRDSRWRRTALVLLAFGAVICVILVNPGIKKLYPWALRRFYPFALPLLAIAQAVPVAWAFDTLRRQVPLLLRAAAATLLAAALTVVVLSARQSFVAVRTADYSGFHDIIRTLSAAMQPGDILVADAPCWLTPFLVAEGRDVVNGECLRDANLSRRAAARALVESLPSRTGQRLLWLTSTSDGLSVYDDPPAVNPNPVVSIDYPATTVIHGQRNKQYSTRTRIAPLRLYTMEIPPSKPAPPPSSPADSD